MKNKMLNAIVKEAREQMMEWDLVDAVPSEVEQFNEMINDFYKRVGKSPMDPYNFTTRLKLKPAQEKELADIAQAFINNSYTDVQSYEFFLVDEKRALLRERYNITTIEDAVNFINTANKIASDKINFLLDSQQIRVLITEATSIGMSYDDLSNFIYDKYMEHKGLAGDDLYEIIHDNLEASRQEIEKLEAEVEVLKK